MGSGERPKTPTITSPDRIFDLHLSWKPIKSKLVGLRHKHDLEWLTTGEAARMCSVTSDAVQKWIQKGRLTAQRTAGGHYRIARRDIEPFVTAPAQARWFRAPPEKCKPQPLRCWEYLSVNGTVHEACRKCVVYRVRASWCFAVLGRAEGTEHSRVFCRAQTSCQECAYYQQVCSVPPRVLVVGPPAAMRKMLGESGAEGLALEFASGSYQASTLIGEFRPVFVVVDEEMLGPGESDLLDCLTHETRVPGLKVILAVSNCRALPVTGDENVFDGFIQKPFDREGLAAFLANLPIERVSEGR